MPKDDYDYDEDKLSPEELDKVLAKIVDKATDDVIVDHLKDAFKKFGIEGAEDVFRRVYSRHPHIVERYQRLYDQLIGRTR